MEKEQSILSKVLDWITIVSVLFWLLGVPVILGMKINKLEEKLKTAVCFYMVFSDENHYESLNSQAQGWKYPIETYFFSNAAAKKYVGDRPNLNIKQQCFYSFEIK